MTPDFSSLFERWTSGERSLPLYTYGAIAAPASALYRVALSARPHLRRRYPALKHSRLIVVSSPLVGGVGKTPITSLLVKELSEAGKQTVIVTMGYRRNAKGLARIDRLGAGVPAAEVGDEAAELFLSTRCPAYVGEEPAEVIDELDKQKAFDCIVFDDGVSRNWDGEKRIVVVSDNDLSLPIRYLPYGRWRTSPDFVRAASYVAITSSSDDVAIGAHTDRLRSWGYDGPVGLFAYRLDGLVSFPEGHRAEAPKGQPYLFCGISRPGRFRDSVRSLGFDDTSFKHFPDHHNYSAATLRNVQSLRQQNGCEWLLTTLKDAVKIDPAWIGSTPLYFLRIALHQVAGSNILTALTEGN